MCLSAWVERSKIARVPSRNATAISGRLQRHRHQTLSPPAPAPPARLRVRTHMLQKPTASTELDSSSSRDPVALPPSTENVPTTFNTSRRQKPPPPIPTPLGHRDTHLSCAAADEFGGAVHRPRQQQRAVLVARQARQRPLVAVLTCGRGAETPFSASSPQTVSGAKEAENPDGCSCSAALSNHSGRSKLLRLRLRSRRATNGCRFMEKCSQTEDTNEYLVAKKQD